MTTAMFFALVGVALFVIGLNGLMLQGHLLRRIMAANIMGAGVFMVLVAAAARSVVPDPVPHAMVLTGIVVAVSATAYALALAVRLHALTGRSCLPEDATDRDESR